MINGILKDFEISPWLIFIWLKFIWKFFFHQNKISPVHPSTAFQFPKFPVQIPVPRKIPVYPSMSSKSQYHWPPPVGQWPIITPQWSDFCRVILDHIEKVPPVCCDTLWNFCYHHHCSEKRNSFPGFSLRQPNIPTEKSVENVKNKMPFW